MTQPPVRLDELIGYVKSQEGTALKKRFVTKDSGAQELLSDAFQDHLFSRFTDRARHTVTAAQEEALQHQNGFIGTEHLALGLLHEPEGLAARAIEALGVPVETARQALVAALPSAAADASVSGRILFTPRGKKVLELALREALHLGHNYIGTEHVLLGVLAEEDGIGARTLTELGVTRKRAMEWLVPELKRLVEAKMSA